MSHSIIGTGEVGLALARLFADREVKAKIANRTGAASVASLTKDLGGSVSAASLDEALDADVLIFAVPFLHFKDLAARRSDWSDQIVVDVTNAANLDPGVLEQELQGRLSSEVNADRVPGAKLVKALNQLPMKQLLAPVPGKGGRRVVFVSSDDDGASEVVAKLVKRIGFAPIQVGKIAEGGRLLQVGNALSLQSLIRYET